MKAKTVLKTNMLILYYFNSRNVSHASCVVNYTLISRSLFAFHLRYSVHSLTRIAITLHSNAIIPSVKLNIKSVLLFWNAVIHPESITIYFWMEITPLIRDLTKTIPNLYTKSLQNAITSQPCYLIKQLQGNTETKHANRIKSLKLQTVTWYIPSSLEVAQINNWDHHQPTASSLSAVAPSLSPIQIERMDGKRRPTKAIESKCSNGIINLYFLLFDVK